jgi:putative NADH-flavin reductase
VRIAVVGASGWIGGSVAREALARGHEVTAIGRDASRLASLDGATPVVADVLDEAAIERAVAGHDAVVSAVTDRTTADRSVIPGAARSLVAALPRAGVRRLVVVGGGGSLLASPGVRFVDLPEFPPQYRAEALAQAEALEVLRADGGALDWSYFSPPPEHFFPAEKTGSYRAEGGDEPVVDAAGESRLGSGDYAAALVDELERPRFVGPRFTASAWRR